ncbi:MAG TPA: DinB family protein [Pyrinomonadaceae bacterium]|nr:DinB family protein [Pyrinomonadaceae bacterium]
MLNKILIELYERDLDKLRTEIESYSSEADIWKTVDGISNSAGNLCLHLCGNLQHFFGAVVGDSGYVRDRPAEFEKKNIARDEMLATIDDTKTVVVETINKLTDEDFAKIYPIEVFGEPITTGYFLTHLTTHFNYHLGQINYHRRLLS